MKSFGGDAVDAFYRHDVQQLNRLLCKKLEGKMKVSQLLLCNSDSGIPSSRLEAGAGAVQRQVFCNIAIPEPMRGLLCLPGAPLTV